MRYAIGIFILFPAALAVMLMVSANYEPNIILLYIDMPALMQYILAVGMVLLITGQFKTFAATLKSLFSKKHKLTTETNDKAIRLFALLTKAVNYTAIFNILATTILLLGHLTDTTYWGPILAIMLLTPMYAVGINLVFLIPATHILKSRKTEEELT